MTKKKGASHQDTGQEEAQNQDQSAEQGFDSQDGSQARAEATFSGDEELMAAEAAEIDMLTRELEQAQAKANEFLDGWQRARAEFANYKRRVERDQAQIYQTTSGNILKRYLEVLDDLDRALKNKPESGEGAAWAQGIELVYRKLLNLLEAEGVKRMEAEGQFFNPSYHEAITHEEAPNFESGQIIEVVNPGYIQGERVLRPALVRVAK